MKLLFLGTGGSMGIPMIGCKCAVCTSSSSYNKRLRPSVLITKEKKRYLIDVGPDYRMQALKYGIDTLDGLLLTHTHYDHVGGFDELRIYPFVQQKPMPCLLSNKALEELKIRYHYLFSPSEEMFKFQILEKEHGTVNFEGLPITYISYDQLGMKVNGFRLETFAYVTDILRFSEEVFPPLRGIETLVMSGRRWERSNAHLSLTEAIEFAKKTGAKKTYFTHIAHEIDHRDTNQKLPEGFSLAYDGLELSL